MLDTRAGRVAAVTLLLVALCGLFVQFGTLEPNPERGHFPRGSHLAADYDRYVGERVRVSGTVDRTDPVVLAVPYASWTGEEYRTGTTFLRVRGVSEPVRQGQELEVFGTAEPDRTIRAADVVATPARNQLYMYVVSLVAGLWVLARIVRGWTVVWDQFALRRRPRPLSISELVGRRFRRSDSTDA